LMFEKRSVIYWIQRLSPAKLLLLFYFLAIIFSTTILMFTFVYKENDFVPIIDVLFTAVITLTLSAFTTISISETYTTPGLSMLTIIMHLGAVGIMAVSTSIWLLLGKRIGLAERRLIMQDQNQTSFGGMVSFIKQIVLAIVIVEIIGILILGTFFLRY